MDFEKRLCCFSLSYSPPPRDNHPAVVQRRHYLTIIIICTQKYSTEFSFAWTWSKPVATPHRILWGRSVRLSLSLSLGKKFKCSPRNDDCLTMINYYIVLLNQASDFKIIKLFCIRSSSRLILDKCVETDTLRLSYTCRSNLIRRILLFFQVFLSYNIAADITLIIK